MTDSVYRLTINKVGQNPNQQVRLHYTYPEKVCATVITAGC